jgi:hypothetical protein
MKDEDCLITVSDTVQRCPIYPRPRRPALRGSLLYFHLAMRSSFANSFRATPRVYTEDKE